MVITNSIYDVNFFSGDLSKKTEDAPTDLGKLFLNILVFVTYIYEYFDKIVYQVQP